MILLLMKGSSIVGRAYGLLRQSLIFVKSLIISCRYGKMGTMGPAHSETSDGGRRCRVKCGESFPDSILFVLKLNIPMGSVAEGLVLGTTAAAKGAMFGGRPFSLGNLL